MKRMRSLMLASLALLAAAAGARADLIELTFDEIAEAPGDGLTVEGITFGLTGGSPGLSFYNDSLFQVTPAEAVNLSGGVLTGDTLSTLTLTFGRSAALRFAALQGTGDVTSFSVELFDGASSLGTTVVMTSPMVVGGLSEGVFEFTGGTFFDRAVINLDDNAGLFGVDNLSLTVVPEPGSLALLGLGAAGSVLVLRRRPKVSA